MGRDKKRANKASKRRAQTLKRSGLGIEPLEDRILLASDFQLAGIQTSESALLRSGDRITSAPSEITLVFSPGATINPDTLSGIEVIGSGGDSNFFNGNESNVVGYIGIGAEPNEAVIRFASPLTDDAYRIVIASTVENDCNVAFNKGIGETITFDVDLGPRVTAVVPQPVTDNGVLSQSRNQIDVYFNNDDLASNVAQNPTFYQLYYTGDTVSNQDDVGPINPVSVSYSAADDMATLTFADDIEDLSGSGSYRLRIGSADNMKDAPVRMTLADAGETASTASNALADVGNGRPIIVSNSISSLSSSPDVVLPGSESDPGHRLVNNINERHVAGGEDADKTAIELLSYNFREVYGIDDFGGDVQNSITEQQKERAREVLELYSYYLGVEFVETEDEGFTIATGDLAGVTGPYGDGFSLSNSDFGASGTSFIDVQIDPLPQPATSIGIEVAVMNGAAQWSGNYGEDWFQSAFVQIGFLLGYGTGWDLPSSNRFGNSEVIDPYNLDLGRGPEQVFPGADDIIHGRYLYNPNSNDVDMYRIDITEAGTITAETFAERDLGSSLDTVLRLFRQVGNELIPVAQNDNYFGSDSLLDVELTSGTYFIGVSSRGNVQYDAGIRSGAGGTTEGRYDLRVEFKSSSVTSLVDTSGQRFDGDSDGVEGGDHNFWFRAQSEQNTIYVQKGGGGTGTGTLAEPYTNLRTAMAAAQPGDIVRVVGNNMGDSDLTNDIPFEIGFDNLGTVLDDGSTDGILRVKQDVVLMIDAGSIFKLHNGAIIVGSDSAIVDRSGSSIQVLGTPDNSVIFTSINNNQVGTDIDPLSMTASPGDWGGIEIRRDRDNDAGRLNYENEGVFLDYINYAEMSYGGGVLQLGSARAVSPIGMVDARPTVTNNLLTFNADAAMSASPNAFKESLFTDPASQGQPFSPDYSRVGPDIHGNTLTNNTTNGLFIVDRSGLSTSSLELDEAARWDDTDIVHVVADSLVIKGNPGGLLKSATGVIVGRSAGSLRIDPGMVVKLDNGRIEVGLGATIIAEGTPENPVIFTSLNDDRYGTGGTFDTSDNGATNAPEPGDWGGIMVRATATGSFDNAVFAYGGGTSTVEGGFASFNVIEAHQAKVRVANSVFELNDNGTNRDLETDRVGRGFNDEATIYVRGAQPIIVNNVFDANLGSAVNVDVNSLNYENIYDTGPSSGLFRLSEVYRTNQGPLVRNNILDGNGINGMTVRGGTLATEGVWDDSDIVHVLRDNVYIPNFHSIGGLSLKSSPTQSLVVKSLGELAGFVAIGSSVGIPDHIGGSLQVLGQPGNPVILTSLFDDTVGAGIDLNGQTQVDTDGGGRPVRTTAPGQDGSTVIELNFGPQIRAFPEVMDAARKAADVWEENLADDVTVTIDVDLSGALSQTPVTGFPGAGVLLTLDTNNFGGGIQFNFGPDTFTTTTDIFSTTAQFTSATYSGVQTALVNDAGDHELLVKQLPNLTELQVEFPTSTEVPFAVDTELRLTTANAKALGVSTGAQIDTSDGQVLITDNLDLFDFDRTDGLRAYREDFQTQFMSQIGDILGFNSSMLLVESVLDNPVASTGVLGQEVPIQLTPLDLFRFAPGDAEEDFTGASRLLDPGQTDHVFYAGGDLDFRHYGYEGITVGEIPLSTGAGDRAGQEFSNDVNANRWRDETFFRDGKLSSFHTIGLMDPVSRLRDQVLLTNDPVANTHGMIINLSEADLLAFDSIGWDVVGGTPGDWAGIRIEELAYDGNIELSTELESGFESNGLPTTSQLLGALAENRNSGNEKLRLGFEVHGAINNPGDVDVYRIEGIAGTDVWIDIDNAGQTLDSSVALIAADQTVLASSNSTLLERSNPTLLGGIAQPFASSDLYTYSTLDAGMKVTLPGSPGSKGFYYVQVRSEGGTSEGRYELQVRLRERDEVPGTGVKYADIRYADTGIRIVGPPSDSPLLGEQVEDESINDNYNEGFVTRVDITDEGEIFGVEDGTHYGGEVPYEVSAQNLGRLGTTRQGAISLFGTLADEFASSFFVDPITGQFSSSTTDDVDWYSFTIDPADTIATDFGLVFDIDYADGVGGPDTVLAVYRDSFFTSTSPVLTLEPNLFDTTSTPELVYYSESSNSLIASDRATSLDSEDVLTGGSFGGRDPYIGPISSSDLGGFGSLTGLTTFYVAVSSIANVPSEVENARLQNLDPIAPNIDIFDPIDPNNPGRGLRRNSSLLQTTPFSPFSLGTRPTWVPNPNAPLDAVTTGEYQLEIRMVPLNGSISNLDPDENRERVQGQLLIANNSITNSRQWGISIVDAFRDQPEYTPFTDGLDDVSESHDEIEVGNFEYWGVSSPRRAIGQSTTGDFIPHIGAPRALPGLNEERVVPGITITNNVISGGLDGGIQMQGDPGGIILDVYDLTALWVVDGRAPESFEPDDLNRSKFTIWDHQGKSQTFQWVEGDGPAEDGLIPIRYNAPTPDDGPYFENELFNANSPGFPTILFNTFHEIQHAFRLSELDITIYTNSGLLDFGDSLTIITNAEGDTVDISTANSAQPQIFIEGAKEIGIEDLLLNDVRLAFSPDDSLYPVTTAIIAQQGAVPYARIVNNTIVGRGGDLFDGNGVGDVGIVVEDNASPTILNNIISNFDVGIRSDFSANDSTRSRSTYVGNAEAIGQDSFSTIYVDLGDDPPPPIAYGGQGLDYFPFATGFLDAPGLHREIDISPTPYTGSRPTVVGATVYQGNNNNSLRIGTGSFDVRLDNNDALFVDAAGGNYFLAESSRAIDSSIDSLPERDYLKEVLNGAGILTTDVSAPDVDSVGILRVDDPSVEPPSGFGSNVFKDRGALERGDFVGPTASLLTPEDNVSPDSNPAADAVAIFRVPLTYFEVLLGDGASLGNPVFGSGIDDSSVVAGAVIVRQDGSVLQEDVDYTLSYDATKNALRILPASGVWNQGDYEIELLNTITDLSGNAIRANRDDGRTIFTVAIDTAAANPWRNPVNPLDVNNNGSVLAEPIDAIQVINELNDPEVSDPETGALPTFAGAGQVPPFVDVNGDGFVSPIDALLVINALNDQSAATAAAPRAALSSVVTFAGQGYSAGDNEEDEEKDKAFGQDDLYDAFDDFADDVAWAWNQK